MTCREVHTLAPLYLSGELHPAGRQSFTAHLAACAACKHEIESQIRLDSRVAEALSVDCPDAAGVVQRFHSRIIERRRRQKVVAAVAALAAGIAAVVFFSHAAPAPAPPWFAEAVRDHRSEVIEMQPRRWRFNQADIETVAAQNGLSYAQAAALAPPGFTLDRARNCGLDGRRSLHLVFTNGAREYSVFVSPHSGAIAPVRILPQDGEQVAGFETGRFRALVVMEGPRQECESLVRLLASRL